MTTAERVRELLDWDAARTDARSEDAQRNHFDRKFQELVKWAEQHPEELEDGR